MELILTIGIFVIIGIVIAYQFFSDLQEQEVLRISRKEELEREFLIRYAHNRKGLSNE